MSYSSENEDDPAVYESSGDEWDESMEVKKRNTRRTSQRLSKKPRITHVVSTDSEEEDDDDDDDDEDEVVKKSVNGVNKRVKKSPVTPKSTPAVKSATTTPVATKTSSTPSSQTNFSTGTFVILKKDAQEGTPANPPCIWKIDGKALLQKYEPFEEDGKVKHRNTSIYTGWSSLDKDQYASIQVQVFVHSGQKMIVELNWDQLKTIQIDSD